MKVKQTVTSEMNAEAIRQGIKAGAFHYGDRITVDGCDWRVLRVDPDKLLIQKCTGLDPHVFNENGSNKYAGSDIERYLKEEFPETLPEEFQELVKDNGFFLLSLEDIDELMPKEIDRICTDRNGDTVSWWTRSAIRGYASNVWRVTSNGGASTNYASNAYRCAPACAIG